MSIKSLVFLVGLAALLVSLFSIKIPNKIIKLWVTSLLILFLWNSCTDHIVYDSNSKMLGKEIVFNRPMAYTQNFSKGSADYKSYKINKILEPLEENTLYFHLYKHGTKELKYVPSDMAFKVKEVYENVPGWLVSWTGGPTKHYVLEDENGKISSIWSYYVENIKYGLNEDFVKDVSFLDNLAGTNNSCELTAIFYQSRAIVKDIDICRSDLKKHISFYGGKVEDHPEGKYVTKIIGNVNTMALVYSSKVELGIKDIIYNSCSNIENTNQTANQALKHDD